MRYVVLSLLATGFLVSTATGATPRHPARTVSGPRIAVPGPGVELHSAGATLLARETAGPDTFALFGGPDEAIEGKFQLLDGATPDWGDGSGLPGGSYGGGSAAWIPVDLTDAPVYWHRSTFNATNLAGNGVSNHAMWSGVASGDPLATNWVNDQGYGNWWDDVLLYESAPVADPANGQVVSLDFFFNHDTEPGFDLFSVEYDRAGTWTRVYEVDGTNADSLGVFDVPGVQYSAEQPAPIEYFGNDYGGDSEQEIRIRLRVTSDGAWSDEDGLWPTTAGAVQLDDITLTTSQGTFTEDFEGTAPYLFDPARTHFAGDFAEVWPLFSDIDPCRDNASPVLGFVDCGQEVRNGPGLDGQVSTGGAYSPLVNYGVPGHCVVNYEGGLSFGLTSVQNEVWSPVIQWDLDGAGDDDPEIAGAFLRLSVFEDLPLVNGVFYTWRVRSARPGLPLSEWRRLGAWLFYSQGDDPAWKTEQFDLTNLLVDDVERIQIALGVIDYADRFGLLGADATPSPFFDDVAVYKYRIGGGVLSATGANLAQDGFPVAGSIDVGSPSARDALDVPFDMARDINSWGLVNVPGDSVVFDAEARIPGSQLIDLRMVWALSTNPLFEDALRSAPARAKDENVVAGAAGSIWTGEVVADSSTTSTGGIIADRFFVDLPDEDFLYPGDVLHYYILATDSDGRVTTLPADITGFGDFVAGQFDRNFTVRALPGLRNAAGEQPEVLVINDFGHRGGEESWLSAFSEMGWAEGEEFDTYTVRMPSANLSNGIGSAGAHGASTSQLAGYHHLLYFSGDLGGPLLSNGSNRDGHDKGDDLGVLQAWHALGDVRNAAYFGDNIATGNFDDPASRDFVNGVLGVEPLGADVRPWVGGQTVPSVVPANGPGTVFETSFEVAGGCPRIARLDAVQPVSGATAAHWLLDGGGNPLTDPVEPAGSVYFATPEGVRLTFPYAFHRIEDEGSPYLVPARSWLLSEILFGAFDHGQGYCVTGGQWPFCTDAPAAVRPVELSVRPNPFNPATTIEFTVPMGAAGSVRIYNLRGELVRTLHTGEFRTQRFEWDGIDDRGARVASGVYLVRAEGGSVRKTAKVALVK